MNNKFDIRQSLPAKVLAFMLACACCVLAVICAFWGIMGDELDRIFFKDGHFLLGVGPVQFCSAAGITALFAVLCIIFLLSASGHHRGKAEAEEGWTGVIPYDVATFIAGMAAFVIGLLYVELIEDLCNEYSPEFNGVIMNFQKFMPISIFAGMLMSGIVIAWLMDTAARIKTRNLIKNTICWKLIKLCFKILKYIFGLACKMLSGIIHTVSIIPMLWKGVLFLAVLSVLDLICLEADGAIYVLYLIGFNLLALYLLWQMKTLYKGAEALASGDLSYKVITKYMVGDFKAHGENLNRLASGASVAVEQRMKSELFKTELITNVSHDIKTPLTSIINYSDLIAAEECDNPKHKEYAEVLKRQGNKLKRLLEDLVEASKAQTGNLDADLVPCDAGIFIAQAEGEYEDRLKAADLTLICSVPDEKIRIMADGRRMQRVIDNLMGNICKYSQPGSRVYINLESAGGEALITFRNISSEELNISSEELMERFVRGDKSRNSEGSGLGLSIARSFTEIQNGKMDIFVDGDLFKVVLRFPKI